MSRPSPLPLWPPFKVRNIYQRFTPEAEGVVENIIEFSVPGVLEGAVQRVPVAQSWEPRWLHDPHAAMQAHSLSVLQAGDSSMYLGLLAAAKLHEPSEPCFQLLTCVSCTPSIYEADCDCTD